MWIKIKEQLINLNHIQTMRWSERGHVVSLYMYPLENEKYGTLSFDWKIRNDDGTKNHDGIARLTNVAKRVAKATNTIVKIFKCELADNNIKNESVGEFIGE
tara:strand:- start:249 stop:554 length:306 start_codon:yes stop_codon:yes gene_type:complete